MNIAVVESGTKDQLKQCILTLNRTPRCSSCGAMHVDLYCRSVWENNVWLPKLESAVCEECAKTITGVRFRIEYLPSREAWAFAASYKLLHEHD